MTVILPVGRRWMEGRLSAEGYRRRKGVQSLGAIFLPACLIVAARVAPPLLPLCLGLGATLVVATYNFGLDVRRTHDLGMSGWWVALAYGVACAGGSALAATSIGVVAILVVAPLSLWLASTLFGLPLGWIGGQVGPNHYGPAPEPAKPVFDGPWMRRVLELSFEPDGSGFVFYAAARSRGIPVSAEEREEYLSASPFGLSTISKRFAGRAPIRPPRPYFPIYFRRMGYYPASLVFMFLAFGSFLVILALGVQESLLRWPMIIFGAFTLILCATIMFAKMLLPPESSEA